MRKIWGLNTELFSESIWNGGYFNECNEYVPSVLCVSINFIWLQCRGFRSYFCEKTRWCTVAFELFLALLLILRQQCCRQTFILWLWEKVRAHSTFSVVKQYCERRTLYGSMQVALGWDAHPSLYMMCACEKGAHVARTETPLFVFHSVRTEVAVWHSQEIALHISELLKGENR